MVIGLVYALDVERDLLDSESRFEEYADEALASVPCFGISGARLIEIDRY